MSGPQMTQRDADFQAVPFTHGVSHSRGLPSQHIQRTAHCAATPLLANPVKNSPAFSSLVQSAGIPPTLWIYDRTQPA
jgi:hypothetical protein